MIGNRICVRSVNVADFTPIYRASNDGSDKDPVPETALPSPTVAGNSASDGVGATFEIVAARKAREGTQFRSSTKVCY